MKHLLVLLSTSPTLSILPLSLCILLLFFSPLTLSLYQRDGNSTDHGALLSFKSQITHDPHGVLATWGSASDHCRWYGVTCHREGRGFGKRVASLVLVSSNLTGSISHHLSNLTFLETLDLSENQLGGPIPQQLGHLSHLKSLLLKDNSLDGDIPPALSNCSQLQFLSLRDNALSGGIPTSLGDLSSLSLLSLTNNRLTGPIIPSLGNLSKLSYLYLEINGFTGGIPPSLGNLRMLIDLFIGFCPVGGIIPHTLWNLSSLTNVFIANTNLTGSLPPDMGRSLPNLTNLALFGNQLGGPLPASLSNASKLESIQLGLNMFTGTIPRALGTLSRLFALLLSINQLEAKTAADWGFLSELANSTNLRSLGLARNKLGGSLPRSLPKSLEWLSFSGNHISGSIPSRIGDLVGLSSLYLDLNRFTGAIPATIGRLRMLRMFNLLGNQMQGEIPSSIGNLTLLIKLDFSSNQFIGSIPATLGNCKHLELLDLSDNNLTGTIPNQVLTISSLTIGLYLSRNSLIGTLPRDIASLRNLETLDLRDNKLSGEIPSSIAGCRSLQYLYLGSNDLSGAIPSSIGQLLGLQVLDLSHNNLSGRIPESLVGIHFIENLNLSFNNLDGAVPSGGVFGNASRVSLRGNDKLCGGDPILNLSQCTPEIIIHHHWSRRLKVILSVSAAFVSLIVLCCLSCYKFRKTQLGRGGASDMGEDKLMRVSYAQLLSATDGFSSTNLIGMGSFGSVYRAALECGDASVVAVKVFNLQQRGASESFFTECEALRNIRHRNLVETLTSCSSTDFQGNDFKALVFEYLSNGNLDQWLHSDEEDPIPNGGRALSLIQRLKVAIDVASAMEYLHQQGSMPIVHCDLKPSNILLDEDMTAHVGDFGLARFLQKEERWSSAEVLKGSIGYAAPEYGMGNKVSSMGDIYSYGIILLEMFTGKRPTNVIFKEGLSLREYVNATMITEQVMSIIDPMILIIQESDGVRDEVLKCIAQVFQIGVMCSSELPTERMNIGDIVTKMKKIKDTFHP